MESYRLIKVINAGRIILGLNKGFGRDSTLYEKLEQGELKSDWVTRDKRRNKTFGIGDYVLVNYEGLKRGIVQDTYKTGNEDERIYEIYLYDHGLIGQFVDQDVAELKRDWQQQPAPRTVIVQLPGVFPVKRVLNLAKMALGETSEVYSQTSEWSRKTNKVVEEWMRADSAQQLRIIVKKTNSDRSVYGDIVRKTEDNKFESVVNMLLKENLAVENESQLAAQLSLTPPPRCQNDPQPCSSKASRVNQKSGESGERSKQMCGFAVEDEESDYMSILTTESSDFDVGTDNLEGECAQQMGIPGYLLVRGSEARPPYKRMEDLLLQKNLIKGLESVGASDLSKFQKAVAPTFMRGLDLIVIAADGGKHAGKHARMLSYFLPLLRILLHNCENMENIEGCSPEAVIVCNSFVSGTNYEGFIQSLLKFSQHLALRAKFLHKDDPKKAWRLPNGVSILILTVNSLNEILQTNKGTKLFDKLRYVIFEELELYASQHFADLANFIETASTNVRFGSLVPFQLTFSGSQWSNEVETLYKTLAHGRSPVVYIHAINQVIRYAKVKWIAHHVEQEEERLNELIRVLGTECASDHRIVIACSSEPVARAVHETLRDEKGIEARLLTSGTVQTNFDKCAGGDVLIIPDDKMASVDVTNATCLISFDCPEYGSVKKATTALRFGYFWKNIRSIDEGSEPGVNLVCHFLLTGKEHNFYALYKFSETLDRVTFPSQLKALAVAMELEGSDNKLCEGTKLFGFCNYGDGNSERCPARHKFTEHDLRKLAHAPLAGEIEFRIIRCENPSLYRVQLLRHFLFENGRKNVSCSYISELKQRSDLIAKYHEQERNLQKTRFEVGSFCSVQDPETNGLTRCQITKVLSKDTFDIPKTVQVNCVDTGMTLNPSVDELFKLSPEQEEWTPLVVDLVLGDLKPPYGEMEYRPSHSKNARKLTTDKIYNAKIWLSIGDTIWVNPMVAYNIDPYLKTTVKESSVRKDLMRMGVAEYNPVHLNQLKDLVQKHGALYRGSKELEIAAEKLSQAEMYDIAVKEDFYQMGDQVRWAFVPTNNQDKVEPVEIATSYGMNPWMFYGVHKKFEQPLRDLEADLSAYVENFITEKYTNYGELFVDLYEPQMVVAAMDLEVNGAWNRAIIIAKYETEDEPNTRFDVCYVDHGDNANNITAKEIFPIPLKFISRLPFQVIAFKLAHVVPVGGGSEWERSARDTFLDSLLPDCESVVIHLLAFRSVGNSDLPVPCCYYEAVAFLNDKELGKTLVEQSNAEFKTGAENMLAGVTEKLLRFYNAVVDQHLGESDDDVVNNPIGNSDLTFEEQEEDEMFEVFVDDTFIHDYFGIKVNGMKQITSTEDEAPPSPPTRAEQTAVQPSTSAAASRESTAALEPTSHQVYSSNMLTPTVRWHQTDTCLILTIMLADIEEYDVRLGADRRTICFKTIKPVNYGFNIKSFGKVVTYVANLTGQSLTLSFTKRMAGAKWVRVLSDKTAQPRWLKPDPDYLSEEDEENPDGYESDEFERWVYNKDEDDEYETAEMMMTLDAEAEIGEEGVHVFFNSDDSDSE